MSCCNLPQDKGEQIKRLTAYLVDCFSMTEEAALKYVLESFKDLSVYKAIQ